MNIVVWNFTTDNAINEQMILEAFITYAIIAENKHDAVDLHRPFKKMEFLL